MKTLVLSDLHLGSRASRAAARFDEINRVAASFDRVILNGDTLDRCYSDPRGDEMALRLIDEALRRCASRNGPPELLTGNHDPAISEIHWIYHEASATLIYHGDCIRDCTHPTKKDDQQLMVKLRERWAELGGRPKDFVALHANYREIQRVHLPIINPYKKPKTALQYALSLIYPPRRPFDVIHYWMKAPERALSLAQGFGRPIKRVVVGHSHRPGRWKIGEVEVFNTGSFMPLSDSFALCLDGEKVDYVPLKALAESVSRGFAGDQQMSKNAGKAPAPQI
ncbi:MAG TPA: metallophosphoesterase [Planctomycetota bacterium]|nr:metallophosphoesterase [Planctomycetota bacterium]